MTVHPRTRRTQPWILRASLVVLTAFAFLLGAGAGLARPASHLTAEGGPQVICSSAPIPC